MIIIIILIIIFLHYYLLGYKLFGDNYKMKNQIIKHYTNLVELKENIEFISPIKPIIPLNIFQTWYTLDLPDEMNKCVNTIKQLNPEFNYYLYDDEMCRQFIINHFHKDVINAYDSLIPGAYKADLWRYCILYIYGGIYMDIKFQPVNGFKFIVLTDKEHFVLDRSFYLNIKKSSGIFNALMITKKYNPILLKSIETIVYNVKNKYYGENCLHPTGPALLGQIYFNSIDNLNDLDLITTTTYNIKITNYNIHINKNEIKYIVNQYIIYKNTIIFKKYNNYRKEQFKYIDNDKLPKHYGILWKQKNIYK
jgi:mannosyltransferase OCH1-like enzyme